MHPIAFFSFFAVGPATVKAFPAELEPFDNVASLMDRAIGSSCTTPYGSGKCAKTSSCTTSGFNLAGYCKSDPTDVQCCVTKQCNTPSGSGVCMNTGDSCGGKFVPGYCPGPDSIQCCAAAKCTTPSGSGICQDTGSACSGGKYIAGYCPGPDTLKCCVKSGTPPPKTSTTKKPPASSSTPKPPSGELKAIDLSADPGNSAYDCFKTEGIQKVVARGYQQACGSGGQVDETMISAYKAAKAAGISSFDAYIYPCTGTTDGVACKSVKTQLDAFLKAIDDNDIKVTYLWIDIEPSSTDDGAQCNSWQLSSADNEALAKEWVAAVKATGRPWGIYANAGQWTSMFASQSTDIGSDLPLWAVDFDEEPGVGTVDKFMGGWTKAYAKQYNLGTKLCGASVDLDSFTA